MIEKYCKACDKVINFENHHHWMGHMSGHSRRSELPPKEHLEKRFICYECSVEFVDGYKLAGHKRSKHSNHVKKSQEEKILEYKEYLKNRTEETIKFYDHTRCVVAEENPTYWIYGHYTDDGILFYVGAGLLKRFFSLNDRNKKHKLIREKYGWTPGILAGPFKTRQEMFEKEIELIAKYHTHVRDPQANHFACNFSIGGECTSRGSRWKYTPEQLIAHRERMNRPEVRAKISAASKRNAPNNPGLTKKGQKLSEEAKKKLSESKQGTKLSEETKQKIRESVRKFLKEKRKNECVKRVVEDSIIKT